MVRCFKSQIKNYKMTKDFSELKNIRSRLEVRPMHIKISSSTGKRTGIWLRNLTTMKELTAVQDKNMGLRQGKYASRYKPTCIYDMAVKFKSKPTIPDKTNGTPTTLSHQKPIPQ